MVLPDVRCIVRVCGAIASLAAVGLCLPRSATAVPDPPLLAYYKPTINAYELYVRPLWFGRSKPDSREDESSLIAEPGDDLEHGANASFRVMKLDRTQCDREMSSQPKLCDRRLSVIPPS